MCVRLLELLLARFSQQRMSVQEDDSDIESDDETSSGTKVASRTAKAAIAPLVRFMSRPDAQTGDSALQELFMWACLTCLAIAAFVSIAVSCQRSLYLCKCIVGTAGLSS
jgi:hypothetical protein